ncbi:MAG: RNA-binding protein [Calothrix sp. SM1_7_51]|nr:RNA-binding protein [Calothrix sp. SM1_7_51]
MSVRLYIGNLPKEEIDRQELQAVFAAEGDTVTTKLIKDRKTGKCRGFGFLTVNSDELADQIIEKYNGLSFKEAAIKIEKALPRTKSSDEQEEKPIKAENAGGAGSTNTSSAPREGKKSKKSRGGKGQRESVASSSGDSDGIRPDPRWAADLEKLKQMLAAQPTN